MIEMLALSGVLMPILAFLLILAILWALVPFAIFGTKPILKDIYIVLCDIRKLLQDVRGDPNTHVLCPACKEPVSMYAKRCRFCLQSLAPAPPPPEPEPKRGILGIFK